MLKTLSVAIIAGLLAASSAHAMALADYLTLRDRRTAQASLMLVGQSHMFANYAAIENGAKPLFCLPAKLKITGPQYEQMLIEYANTNHSDGSAAIEMLMLLAIMETFPCR